MDWKELFIMDVRTDESILIIEKLDIKIKKTYRFYIDFLKDERRSLNSINLIKVFEQ